jgi:hypothetical protein
MTAVVSIYINGSGCGRTALETKHKKSNLEEKYGAVIG